MNSEKRPQIALVISCCARARGVQASLWGLYRHLNILLIVMIIPAFCDEMSVSGLCKIHFPKNVTYSPVRHMYDTFFD